MSNKQTKKTNHLHYFVKTSMIENDLDMLCLQKTEIEANVPNSELTLLNYSIEIEIVDNKGGCGWY